MSKVINVGVIGCGRIAQMMHLPYLQQLDEYNLYSICDISAHVVDEVGRLFAVDESRRFTDIDAMLSDPALEAVIICTKDHYEPAIKAAKAGKHMIVEKPLAYNVRQAREMIEAAKENKVIMMVGYMKRYDPGFTIEFTHPYFKNQCAAVKILEDDGAKGSIESLIVPNHEEEYICELRHFYDCITNGKIPYTTAEDAIEDLIMTDEMVRMAAAMNRIDKNE